MTTEIKTGHKTFDKQCYIICRGNVISNCLTSNYIRSFDDLECNGIVNKPGHLRDFDLQAFARYEFGERLRNALSDHKHEKLILYALKTYKGNRRIVHGYILTDYDHRLILSEVTGPTYHSRKIIDWCVPHLAEIPPVKDTICREQGDWSRIINSGQKPTHFLCCSCGQTFPVLVGNLTSGYGYRRTGECECYSCIAESEKREMIETGKWTAYLTESGVCNWPGSLKFEVSGRVHSRAGFCGKSEVVYFTGPDGSEWMGRNMGDSQICHCRRLK